LQHEETGVLDSLVAPNFSESRPSFDLDHNVHFPFFTHQNSKFSGMIMPPRLKKKEKHSNERADSKDAIKVKGKTRSKAVRGLNIEGEACWKICPICLLMLLTKYVRTMHLFDIWIKIDSQPLLINHRSSFDLLRLAKTTKAFRALLMNQSSIAIWKSACQLFFFVAFLYNNSGFVCIRSLELRPR
jgi:hypothetical protein